MKALHRFHVLKVFDLRLVLYKTQTQKCTKVQGMMHVWMPKIFDHYFFTIHTKNFFPKCYRWDFEPVSVNKLKCFRSKITCVRFKNQCCIRAQRLRIFWGHFFFFFLACFLFSRQKSWILSIKNQSWSRTVWLRQKCQGMIGLFLTIGRRYHDTDFSISWTHL